MTENKQKLIDLVSALETEASIDYFYTFIALKLYGKADCPDSKIVEVCEMWERHMKPRIERQEQEHHELTADEKIANDCRRSILGMVYDIQNLDILNYIKIIVEDIAKEDSAESKQPNYIGVINKALCGIESKDILRCIYVFISDITKEDCKA